MTDHARALVGYLRRGRPIQPDGRKQIEVEGARIYREDSMSPTGARQDLQTIQQSVAAGSVVVASTGTGPFEQILLDRRHALRTDEPVPEGGSEAGPGPYELLLHAVSRSP